MFPQKSANVSENNRNKFGLTTLRQDVALCFCIEYNLNI